MVPRRYVFVHGPKSDSWYWHRVVPRVVAAGFEAVAVDLPIEDDEKGLAAYAEVVAAAVDGHPSTTIVTHSMGAFVAPMVVGLVDVSSMVLVAPMAPRHNETAAQWMHNTGVWDAVRLFAVEEGRDPSVPFSAAEYYLHDVPPEIVPEFHRHTRVQSERPFGEPWPLADWPRIPTTCIVGRHDRLYTYDFQRRVLAARLGLTPRAVEGGHLCALSAPEALTEQIISAP